jgi:hypothetical protein
MINTNHIVINHVPGIFDDHLGDDDVADLIIITRFGKPRVSQ